MTTRKPTPTPNVPAVPRAARMALPMKAPRNRDTAAISLWSRERTFLCILSKLGSVISSTQTVVNTTTR